MIAAGDLIKSLENHEHLLYEDMYTSLSKGFRHKQMFLRGNVFKSDYEFVIDLNGQEQGRYGMLQVVDAIKKYNSIPIYST